MGLTAKVSLDRSGCAYGDGPTGSVTLRTSLARFLTERFTACPTVRPEDIVVSSGLTALNDMLAWTLADAGDGIMVGRPLYCSFPSDFWARAKVRTVAVAFDGTDPFAPGCVGFYERAIVEWNNRPANVPGRVRVLVIVNPHNPLGLFALSLGVSWG